MSAAVTSTSTTALPPVCPLLNSTERTPLAMPRRAVGRAAMIEAVFGAVKIPFPAPISSSPTRNTGPGGPPSSPHSTAP